MIKTKRFIWQLVETDEVITVPDDAPPVTVHGGNPSVKPPDIARYPKTIGPVATGSQPTSSAIDHPIIGGSFTIFALGFGDHIALMERCLESIIHSTPKERRELRVALNQPSPRLLAYVSSLPDVAAIYATDQTRYKYQAMRQMFYDPSRPITTQYLLWFDDDSWVVDPSWLSQLSSCIVQNHPDGARLYGTRYIHDLATYVRQGKRPDRWFKAATWWRGKPLFSNNGHRETPNGTQIVFATGGFWALHTETMRIADIPDSRLVHNGGDCTIGCQVHQAGFRVKDFSRGKRPVCWSDAPRRGYREAFPWTV